jgi:hypothetical protein
MVQKHPKMKYLRICNAIIQIIFYDAIVFFKKKLYFCAPISRLCLEYKRII